MGQLAFGHAVDQADVEMVGAELLAEAVDFLLGPAGGRDPRAFCGQILLSSVNLSRGMPLITSLTKGWEP